MNLIQQNWLPSAVMARTGPVDCIVKEYKIHFTTQLHSDTERKRE